MSGNVLFLARATVPSKEWFLGTAHCTALEALRHADNFGDPYPTRIRYQFVACLPDQIRWTVTLEYDLEGRIVADNRSITATCGCAEREMCAQCDELKTAFWEFDFNCSIAEAAHAWRTHFAEATARLITERWERFESSEEVPHGWTPVAVVLSGC